MFFSAIQGDDLVPFVGPESNGWQYKEGKRRAVLHWDAFARDHLRLPVTFTSDASVQNCLMRLEPAIRAGVGTVQFWVLISGIRKRMWRGSGVKYGQTHSAPAESG